VFVEKGTKRVARLRSIDPGRRQLLRSVSAGVMGAGLADLLSCEAFAKAASRKAGKAKNVLVVYEEGGISQMDSWDPKPEQTLEHRSPFKPVTTNVPGIYSNGPCGGPQAEKNSERYGLPHPVMMPATDRAFSALLEDLDERGLLDETLVCFITEMGRTPRINKWQGRDHWGRAMSIAFAGAGVQGGQVIGATDRDGGDVIADRHTPYDYAETIYQKLGIDTHARLHLPDGRPIDFTDGGRPISQLF
jgi:hypothetical protein